MQHSACDLQLSPAGFEPTTYGLKVPEKREHGSVSRGAQYNSDLQRIIDAWPTLSDELREAILRVAALGEE